MIAAEGPHDDELRALRAENERLKSELANLNAICDSLPAMISHVGADFRFIHLNKTYERFFPHPAEWAIGRHLSEVAGEPHLSLARPFAERALRGERVSFESRIRHRDGTMHDIAVTYTPRRAPDGSVSGFIALVEDITDKKAIEERVRESEERLRLALESAGMVAWEWNVETDAVLRFGWNPELLGPEPAQCGRDFFASVHPDDRAQLAAAYHGALENGHDYQLEFRLVAPDGTIRWMNDRGGLKTDSRGRRLLRGVFTDITELKSTMTALRESEERYRFLANSLPLFIWTGGFQKVDFINDYWYQYTGLPRDVPFDSWPEVVHPEDLKELIPAIELARQTNGEAAFEYRVRRADGPWRWHAGVEKRQSDPDRWLGFGFEIHDIRMAAAALRESEERHR
ncbi:MAG TPA: PAS domain S-box protein, partial [Bryobacteraceae bacterium]|nr:PAS domain S-box protein [Bryobacteraceae bacterium]